MPEIADQDLIHAATLLAHRAEWRILADALFDAILLVNRDGRVVMANQQAVNMLEYPREEILGYPVERFMPERFRDRHADYRTAFVNGSKQPRYMGAGADLFILTRDQREVPVSIGLSSIVVQEGSLVVVTIRPRK